MVEQLFLETVIIVACVCGTVVLVLTIILIVLCCRKHQEFYEKTETYIGNALDCPLNELQIKAAPAVKSTNVDIARHVVDTGSGSVVIVGRDNHIGGYSCSEHTSANANLSLHKVLNIDSVACDDRTQSEDWSYDPNGTLNSDGKRSKKIIYEVVV